MDEKACSRETIIFVHGNASSRAIWNEVIAALPERFECVTFDLPGHGVHDSTVPGSFELLTDALASVVAGVEGGAVHLVGHSLGGLICARFARNRPGKVRTLSLLATPLGRTSAHLQGAAAFLGKIEQRGLFESLSSLKDRWYTTDFATRHPEVLADRLRQLEALDPRVFVATYKIYIDPRNETSVADLRMPVFFLSGELADGFDPSVQEELARHHSHASCLLYPGIKNGILTECPERVAGDIERFISVQRKPL
ncbi:MAG: alpha/beta hydrolase [Nitratireductor sp.]